MMKRAFTLLELVVVIIILGVLATLGITQYGRMVERMRRAEYKVVLGDIRKLAYAYWLANGTTTGITNANVNIGPAADQIPGPDATDCRSTHYFYYYVHPYTEGNRICAVAYRCTSGGKEPQGQYVAYTAWFEDFVAGWGYWGVHGEHPGW